jgi:hypothetical protein
MDGTESIQDALEEISPSYDMDQDAMDELAGLALDAKSALYHEYNDFRVSGDGDPAELDFQIPYPTRGPRDVVISGPTRGGWGPGRWMPNRYSARLRAVSMYGEARVLPVPYVEGRWAFLIRNLKAAE